MSGLFARLAQLHINQRASRIKPVKSPVFPLDINEHGADASSVGNEQSPSNQNLEASRQAKSVGEAMNVTKVSNFPRFSTEESSSAQSQTTGHSDVSPISPIIYVTDEQNPLPDTGEFDSLLGTNNSLLNQPSNNHQSPSTIIKKRNARPSQRNVDSEQGESQATVNISIGQIDIRATRPEKSEKKPSVRPKRTRPNALEEYHQKRLRGER